MERDSRRPLRVLAADDSTVMHGVLRTVFELHASHGDGLLPPMELCGLVRDGVEALDAVRSLCPDVMVLDLEMPRMSGLEVLTSLRQLAPRLPVIMCSAYTQKGARSTLDALALGAKDYVMKPGQQKDFAAALDSLMEQLLPKIAALAGPEAGHPASSGHGGRRVEFAGASVSRGLRPMEAGAVVEMVVIGVSTGGPSALEVMLAQLPADLRAPVMIVQHMPRLFTGALAERLNRLCRLPVRQAQDGAAVVPGTIWLAPGDAHMEVVSSVAGGRRPTVKLHQGPALNSCRPSVDYLFRSAAALFGANTLGLIMTGMGSDGVDGARAIQDAGGVVLAQDEASSAVWGMPGRAVRAGVTTATIPLEGLARALTERVNGGGLRRLAVSSDVPREAMYGLL